MPIQQPGGPKDPDRDIQRKDVGGDETAAGKTKPAQQRPGMGEDEKETYVPEKERP